MEGVSEWLIPTSLLPCYTDISHDLGLVRPKSGCYGWTWSLERLVSLKTRPVFGVHCEPCHVWTELDAVPVSLGIFITVIQCTSEQKNIFFFFRLLRFCLFISCLFLFYLADAQNRNTESALFIIFFIFVLSPPPPNLDISWDQHGHCPLSHASRCRVLCLRQPASSVLRLVHFRGLQGLQLHQF